VLLYVDISSTTGHLKYIKGDEAVCYNERLSNS
jgi:hypothetical protein